MRESWVAAIERQRSQLLGVLAGVSGQGWDRPTVCSPWSVKDVVAHLVQGEIGVGLVYRGEVDEQGYVDADEGVAQWSPLPGEAVRAALWQHGSATQRVLGAMTTEAWQRPIRAFGCRTVAQLVRLHLFDLTVHAHDVTQAVDAPPLWGSELPFLIEHSIRAAPAALHRHGVRPAGTVAVSVEDLSKTWLLDGHGERWTVDAGEPDAAAVLEADAETLVLVATGRAGQETTARVRIRGDEEAARLVLDGWRVVS